MAAYEVLLLNTAIPQIQAAQAGDTYVVPRDIAFSAALTLSAGTANGVPYLDGSKVLTTGSALTFDGTTLATTTLDTTNLEVTNIKAKDGTAAMSIADSTGVVSITANPVLSGGTANGVLYLNASKVATSGSALTFDGSYFTAAGLRLRGLDTANTIYQSTGNLFITADTGTLGLQANSNNPIGFYQNSSEKMRLTGSSLNIGGNFTSTNNTLQVTGNAAIGYTTAAPTTGLIVAGDVGIGTSSPGWKLEVNGIAGVKTNNANAAEFHVSNASASARDWVLISSGSSWAGGGQTGYFNIYDNTAGQQRLTIDTSGNLGLGVTPSAWSGFTALQVGGATSIWSSTSGAGSSFYSNNVYFNGSNRIRINAGYATEYIQDSSGGAHIWYNAASSTAGSTISFTQAMTLGSDGNLLVGKTSGTGYRFEVTGNGVFLSNTSAYAAYLGQANIFMTTGAATDFAIRSDANLLFGAGGSTERARITSGGLVQVSSGGSVQVGGTAARATTAGTNRVDIFNGTAPVGTLANGVSLYSSSGEAYVMDAAGNATLFSPHDAETNEWIFKSKHTPSGKVLKIDVEKMLRFINDHFGLDAIHEFTEEA